MHCVEHTICKAAFIADGCARGLTAVGSLYLAIRIGMGLLGA
ncbi:MAG: hypothetical protein OXH50_14835 [Gemmatimonadetes bacterium]|nr:hypothetical protein [Gemmatimonadota bacterium]